MDFYKSSKHPLPTGVTRVMVADDSPTQVRLVEKCLLQIGFPKKNIVTATSTQTALDAIIEHRIDILLLDLHLPERVFAIDLIKKIRRRLGRAMSILVFSAHSERSEVQEAFSAGANGYLLKPISVSRLREKIEPLIHHVLDVGEYLVHKGYATKADIDWAIDLQRNYFGRVQLAKAALWLGYINPDELVEIMNMYQCHDDDSFLEKCRLCHLLEQGQINSLQKIKFRVEHDLGGILDMMGIIKKDVFDHICSEIEFVKKDRLELMPPELPEDDAVFGLDTLPEAAKSGDRHIAERLIAKGVSVDTVAPSGKTALLLACENGDFEMCYTLIAAGAGVNVQSQDRTGWRPLMYAIKENHVKILGLLLLHGADPFLTNRLKETSFTLAIEREVPMVLDALLENSIDRLQKDRLTWSGIVSRCRDKGGAMAKVILNFKPVIEGI